MAPLRAARHFLGTTAVGATGSAPRPHLGTQLATVSEATPAAAWLSPSSLPRASSKQSYQQEHPWPHICRPLLGTSNDSVKWKVSQLHQPLQFRSQKQLFSTKAGGGVGDKSLSWGQQKADQEKHSCKCKGSKLSTPQELTLPSCSRPGHWQGDVSLSEYVLAIRHLGKGRVFLIGDINNRLYYKIT